MEVSKLKKIMSSNNNKERVAYFNGKIVPESDVKVPFRDRGFKYGDAVFDMTRTFDHKIFKLEGHIKRFYNSLKYIQIDPGLSERSSWPPSPMPIDRCPPWSETGRS